MKPTIIAKDKEHLKQLIAEEINLSGNECDLNHINVSNVTDMEGLFFYFATSSDVKIFEFNGNISQWDVSNVEDMTMLFYGSKFNGDISKWNVSSVKHMGRLFKKSNFNGDISNWNVSNVNTMYSMFENSKFNGDLSGWTPYNLEDVDSIFLDCSAPTPYWAKYEDKEARQRAIELYHMHKTLDQSLEVKEIQNKRAKI